MSATFSECGKYRYLLGREFPNTLPTSKAVFVMLNPSTADATEDDPTIRRCIGFAKSWGYSGLIVANIYGLRSTKPAELWASDDPIGPENDGILRGLAHKHGEIICAWGANAKADRVSQFRTFMTYYGAELLCLGMTISGAPRHPLYLKKDAKLRPWELP